MKPVCQERRNRIPSQVSTLFLKALRITKVPWNKPPYSLPADEVCGPWGAQQGRKQPKLCPCNHFSRNHHSCHSCISCVHCTSYFEDFSNPWYRLIVPSACEADYRNLIHRRKGDSEPTRLAQGHTAAEWQCQDSYRYLMVPRAASYGPYTKAASTSEWTARACSRALIQNSKGLLLQGRQMSVGSTPSAISSQHRALGLSLVGK